jgi:hypothetical protein
MDRFQSRTGYLIIFNTNEKGLRCGWTANHGGVPFLQISDKIIYILIIAAVEIKSASTLGSPDPVVLKIEDLHPIM